MDEKVFDAIRDLYHDGRREIRQLQFAERSTIALTVVLLSVPAYSFRIWLSSPNSTMSYLQLAITLALICVMIIAISFQIASIFPRNLGAPGNSEDWFKHYDKLPMDDNYKLPTFFRDLASNYAKAATLNAKVANLKALWLSRSRFALILATILSFVVLVLATVEQSHLKKQSHKRMTETRGEAPGT